MKRTTIKKIYLSFPMFPFLTKDDNVSAQLIRFLSLPVVPDFLVKNYTTMFSPYCIPLVLKQNKDKRKRLILLWFAPKHAEISTMHAKMSRRTTGFIF